MVALRLTNAGEVGANEAASVGLTAEVQRETPMSTVFLNQAVKRLAKTCQNLGFQAGRHPVRWYLQAVGPIALPDDNLTFGPCPSGDPLLWVLAGRLGPHQKDP